MSKTSLSMSTGPVEPYFIGVDVGTSSVRAALVNTRGRVLKQVVKPIKTWTPQKDHYEQSSEDIWQAVCYCVKNVSSEVPQASIMALSFDATCSLVIIGESNEPLSVSLTEEPERNVILWMDHRANFEADDINATQDDILRYVGGKVSLEMEMPKLLWLKRNMPYTFKSMAYAFDLVDYLTWRATDDDSRSLCTVTCKWNYDAQNMQWKRSFLEAIDLKELCDDEFEKIGHTILLPGTSVGMGLTAKAAKELNLLEETCVGAGLIDAHAGALAMLGCRNEDDFGDASSDIASKMALIGGTSTCHMCMTRLPCEVDGIWGPYQNAILPMYYLNEAGQSATGILLDSYLQKHPQYAELSERYRGDITLIYKHLNELLDKMAAEENFDDIAYLTKHIHVWPDFHGNRSPIADPKLRGMISGLSMDTGEQSMALLYLAIMQSLAYGTRHIISTLTEARNLPLTTLLFCGGLTKNPIYIKCHADICQMDCIVPNDQEKVLVGAAMLGATAAGYFDSLENAVFGMSGSGKLVPPNQSVAQYHHRKYTVFLAMLNDQRKYQSIMTGGF